MLPVLAQRCAGLQGEATRPHLETIAQRGPGTMEAQAPCRGTRRQGTQTHSNIAAESGTSHRMSPGPDMDPSGAAVWLAAP